MVPSPLQDCHASREPSPLEGRRVCGWCRGPIATRVRRDAVFCSVRCRQAGHRLGKRAVLLASAAEPARFAYADPPYPGTAKRCYGKEPSYAGEVDHAALIARLMAGGYAGWALSTSAKALRHVLALCPEGARVCAWVKPNPASPQTFGFHNLWEPLIVYGGRQVQGACVRDFLIAKPARGEGTLIGRKSSQFCAWLFALLGMRPGDELDDIFPGTEIVSRAWAELSRRASCHASLTAASDASLGTSRDASLGAGADASPEVLGDASPRARGHGYASSTPAGDGSGMSGYPSRVDEIRLGRGGE